MGLIAPYGRMEDFFYETFQQFMREEGMGTRSIWASERVAPSKIWKPSATSSSRGSGGFESDRRGIIVFPDAGSAWGHYRCP